MKKTWDSIKDYVYIIIAVLIFRTFIAAPALVDGTSMDDTLHDNELIIINKMVYAYKDIERFDIVVLNNTEDGDKIIKRVIGLPNEKIEYKDNVLYINDVETKYTIDFEETNDFVYETKSDEYFVLGDNRDVSKDSRYLGAFSKKEIIGRVNLRLFPFNKFGKIEK